MPCPAEARLVPAVDECRTLAGPSTKDASLARKTRGARTSPFLPPTVAIGTFATVAAPPSRPPQRFLLSSRSRSQPVAQGPCETRTQERRPHVYRQATWSRSQARLGRAPYGARNGAALTPSTDATLMTEPAPPAPNQGAGRRVAHYMPSPKVHRITLSQSGHRISRSGTHEADSRPRFVTTMSG